MRCHQCSRPALYQITDQEIPLCLICFERWQSIQNIQFLQNAAMMNQSLDDMDEISGISSSGGRIPVSEIARAMQRKQTYNNINITNSQVGVVNTGDLAKIDAAITITTGSDTAIIGQKLKALTQAVVDANEMNAAAKNEMVELLQSLSDQIVGGRRRSVIVSLLKSIEDRAKGINAIVQLAASLKSAILALFGGDIPT